ncbi:MULTISPECIES: hypothetical protein [unclassified Sphingomonas]|uniref:hypothetical protein n=1 Tax=unclassified Sphingomonas TaxID=196159 RepID=UPI001FB4F13C|nr:MULTISPECIES: hypothetical protein [unclassified Sphingomonas]
MAGTFITGCTAQVPVEGPIALGQTAFVDGPKVRADRVIEDSRCPVDAQCVWAGRLVVRATVMGGGWSRQIELTLGMPVNVADGALTLVAASPVRRVDAHPAKGSAYRFTFEFRGGR